MHFDNCRTNPTLKSFNLVTVMKEFIYLRDSFIYKREMYIIFTKLFKPANGTVLFNTKE
ncbi:hypothetical protein SDC9_40666 [bioreactor metagenome]|uniref:Uncharacterized protein n=1 Tax=bioreactor metagenome TaxID=1076179 RepID=A0A644VVM9_9ZZZZ